MASGAAVVPGYLKQTQGLVLEAVVGIRPIREAGVNVIVKSGGASTIRLFCDQ